MENKINWDELLKNVDVEPTKTKKIKVIIEEHISQEFIVEASDIDEAMEIAEQMYYDGEFVVDAFNAPTAQLMYADDGENQSEWTEF